MILHSFHLVRSIGAKHYDGKTEYELRIYTSYLHNLNFSGNKLIEDETYL